MSKSIVIVEDEYFFRQALKKYIQEYPDQYYILGEASNGRTGLALLQNTQPDIALVDITMPLMDGIQLIRSARDEELPTRIIILTGYSKFEYAKAALQLGVKDYLLKPLRSEELISSLNRVSAQIDYEQEQAIATNHELRRILSEQLAEQLIWADWGSDENNPLFEQLNFPMDGRFAVTLFQWQGDQPGEGADNKARVNARTLINHLNDLIPDHFCYLTCISEENIVCLILRVEAGDPDGFSTLKPVLKNLTAKLSSRLGRVIAAVGLPRNSIEQIRSAYQEALTVQRYHLFKDERSLHFFKSQDAEETHRILFPKEYRWHLKMLLRSESTEEITRFIHKVFKHMEHTNASSDAILLSATEILCVILEFTEESDRDSSRLRCALMPRLMSLKYLQNIRAFVLETALQAISIPVQSEEARTTIVQSVNEYIEKNYGDPNLCLGMIAEEQYICVSYLCTLYKKLAGTTIGKHIVQVRLSHACQLLFQGAKNIHIIAKHCGYEDPGYFSRCFHKEFGISPIQYISSNGRPTTETTDCDDPSS